MHTKNILSELTDMQKIKAIILELSHHINNFVECSDAYKFFIQNKFHLKRFYKFSKKLIIERKEIVSNLLRTYSKLDSILNFESNFQGSDCIRAIFVTIWLIRIACR